jgi:glycosyltransferase involved in cell wall biosynthesis
MILVIQSTTFGAYGGIPTYNRMVCRALNDLSGSLVNCERRVLIATDIESETKYSAQALPNLSFEAFGGNRSAFARRTIAIALTRRIDLLLIGHINYAPLGLALKALRPSLRYGVTVHGVEVWNNPTLLKRCGLRRADFLMAVSEYTKAKVAEIDGIRPEHIKIIPDTIVDSDEEVGDDTGEKLNGLLSRSKRPTTLLLSVCRLEATEKYKGVDTVIYALPAVIAQVPEAHYLVIGSGSDLERHRRLAAEAGVADRVHFLGSVDDATLQRCYRECDVFILPSDGEGFGIVYLEAMHYGKPVIAANSRAVPEVVKHNETGLLIEYGDSSQLAEAMTSLCLDQSLRERMGKAGRKRLGEKFSFEFFKQRFHELVLDELRIVSPSAQHTIAPGVASADL